MFDIPMCIIILMHHMQHLTYSVLPTFADSFECSGVWDSDSIPVSCFPSLFFPGRSAYKAIPVTMCQPSVFIYVYIVMLERAGGCHSQEEK